MEPSTARRKVDLRPLRAAMDRMNIPLRRIRQNFRIRFDTRGGLYGQRFWRDVGGGEVGGFLGFLTNPEGWEVIEPRIPEAIVFAFVRPIEHALHHRLVVRKNSLYSGIARKSAEMRVGYELHRDREEALIRHRSMQGRPDEILVLSASDFFMTSFRVFWAANFIDRIRALSRRKSRRASR